MARNNLGVLVIKTLLVTVAISCLSACDGASFSSGQDTETGGGGSGSSSGSGSTGSTTSNGGVACGSNDFCINVVPPTDTTMVLHQDGAYAQPCTVTAGSNTACILEADELDLYDQGLSITYNVPPGMCSYFQMMPYFYYQYQPGIGPKQVTITVNSTTGAVTEMDSDDGIPNSTTATTQKVTVRTPYTITPDCSADYTSDGGPNCCSGDYSLTVVTDGIATTTQATWGGNPNNCLVGPAMATQPLYQSVTGALDNGYPKSTLIALDGKSVSGTYAIKSPLSLNYLSNAYIANFWQSGATGDYPLTTDGVGTGSPNAMQGPALSAGVFVPGCYGNFCTGNPWYEFDCLDAADDFVARVRVMVRSWTSNVEFATFVANQTGAPATGTYNLYGSEPSPFSDQPIEDLETWVTPYSSTLGAGVAGAVNSQCYNTGQPTQDCGYGSMYPGQGN